MDVLFMYSKQNTFLNISRYIRKNVSYFREIIN